MNRMRFHAIATAATLLLSAFGAQAVINTNGGVVEMLRASAVLNEVQALIVAGDPTGSPPDSVAARVDPNLTTSPFSGVVSLNIRYSNGVAGQSSSFICSGAFVSAIHIVTAAHCIDTNGNGNAITIGDRNGGVAGVGDVRAIFNTQATPGGANSFTLGSAVSVSMHPDYKGFGKCPAVVLNPSEFCINDDVAVITLGAPAPSWVKQYQVGTAFPDMSTEVVHVGFGTTGDGVAGYTSGSASFFIKRVGYGRIDRPLDELNDEGNFSGSPEVWAADFDSIARGIDTHCVQFGVCSTALANDKETTLGGGDSGGPSFVNVGGQFVLVGNNTYSRTFFQGQVGGTFGTGYGGMILGSYADFLTTATNGAVQFTSAIPEPGTYAMMALGLLGLGAVSRRRMAK